MDKFEYITKEQFFSIITTIIFFILLWWLAISSPIDVFNACLITDQLCLIKNQIFMNGFFAALALFGFVIMFVISFMLLVEDLGF